MIDKWDALAQQPGFCESPAYHAKCDIERTVNQECSKEEGIMRMVWIESVLPMGYHFFNPCSHFHICLCEIRFG